jgi:hypothetical protein
MIIGQTAEHFAVTVLQQVRCNADTTRWQADNVTCHASCAAAAIAEVAANAQCTTAQEAQAVMRKGNDL